MVLGLADGNRRPCAGDVRCSFSDVFQLTRFSNRIPIIRFARLNLLIAVLFVKQRHPEGQ